MSPDRRQINDSRLSLFGHGKERLIAFVCECADADCRRTVTLTAAEGSELRQQGKPILFRGHVADEDGPLAGEPSTETSESRSPEAPTRKGSG